VSDPFTLLLEVQDHDTRIDQLRHRRATLPGRAEMADLDTRRRDLDARSAKVRLERDEHGARQAALEQQIEVSKGRRAELQKRLFGGQVAAARELQAMDEEVRHLGRHIGELEDRELEVMELIEPLDIDLRALEVERDGIDTRRQELLVVVGQAEADIDALIEAAMSERRPLAADVPADLLERYEMLRTRLGGTGAARLVGGSCSGCHLALPAMEVDRIKKAPPDGVITCDNCGRILVR